MPAVAFVARKPGKLSVVGSASSLESLSLQLLALPEPDERAWNRSGIGVSRRGSRRRRGQLKLGRRGYEVERALSRRSKRGRSRPRPEAP